MANEQNADSELDLVITRQLDVPRQLIWRAWTQPEHVMKWFTPAPWQTIGCEIDLRPGGAFRWTMRSPQGEESTHHCCYLEVAENERLVWTDALGPGYRPGLKPFITAIIQFEDHAGGTRYTTRALHKDAATRDDHLAKGFYDGWGTCIDQMVDVIGNMKP